MSNKIIALSMACIMIIGSAVYLKLAPQMNQNQQDQQGVLSYDTETTPDTTQSTDVSNTSFKVAPEDAFANSSFSDSDNLTDRFAKTAFASYIDLQNQGLSDEDSQASVVSDLVDKAQLVGYDDIYSINDLKTFSDSDKVAIKAYANTVATIEFTNFSQIKKNQDKYNGDLNAIADVYDTTGAQLSKIAVPAGIISTHLEFINNYHNTARSLRDIALYQDDPLKGMVALKKSKDVQTDQASVYIAISDYLTKSGILFDKGEAGRALLQ